MKNIMLREVTQMQKKTNATSLSHVNSASKSLDWCVQF